MITAKFVSEQIQDGRYVRRPKIPVTLSGPRGVLRFLTLIDSGTDVTILPKAVADFIGLTEGPSSEFLGLGEQPVTCTTRHVDITIHGRRTQEKQHVHHRPVLVPTTAHDDEPVLGCEGFFDRFDISFLHRRRIRISPASSVADGS